MKNLLDEELTYNNYLQKLNWFIYLNTKKHDKNIANKLIEKYGKNTKMIIGDWSGKGKISYISTPCVGFKKTLRKTFPTYLIDEYKTSKISSTTLTETNKLNLRINGHMCELYPVLTFSMSNQRLGCINRDKNATLNFQKIIRSLIETQKRPIEFLRAQPKSSINPPKHWCVK